MELKDRLAAKNSCRQRLANLLAAYDEKMPGGGGVKVSEETIRSWLNEFLAVFGWDVKDVSQVWQEANLSAKVRHRLAAINSRHKRPDYTLLDRAKVVSFVDAKAPDVDVFGDKSVAFQIRSYGWSAQVPCAFVSNFEQFAIFDTRFVPKEGQSALDGVIQIPRSEYLEKFDVLFDHLWRDDVLAGRLPELYEVSPSEGTRTLDGQFANLLSSFRVRLAEGIYAKNRTLIPDDSALNYYVQVILDRMIFIRVCESRGIEKRERLRGFQKSRDGFWHAFRKSCYMEFHRHYDGAMFERDQKFSKMEIEDCVFGEFIEQLYYPSPYRFDVIPVMLLDRIYEEFLGKRLVILNGRIEEVFKGEYVKTNGAIPTPEHLVRKVCETTLDDTDPKTGDDLFGRKVLDPCCGSGIFLTACYEMLEAWFVGMLRASEASRRKFRDLYYVDDCGNWILTIPGRRKLITECLFGIDLDEAAVEVTKMSLALKIIDGNYIALWKALGAYGDRILRDISANVRLGNALVPADEELPDEKAMSLKALDPKAAFPAVFGNGRGGFSYIVCNPPYVETKFFKAADSSYHAYLSEHYRAFEGKADLAVLFIERCRQLIARSGKIGLIVQRRWFKSEYGVGIRTLIDEEGSLDTVVEYSATDMFPGRTTYVAIVKLSGTSNKNVRYTRVPGGEEVEIPHPTGGRPWVFNGGALTSIRRRLLNLHGRFADFPGIQIKDGIQALWKKMYHVRNVAFNGDVATGVNGFGENVRIEKGILRGVVYNRVFYPFKPVEPDAWCIFPYRGSTADAILWSEMKEKFPLAYKYFEAGRRRIQDAVKCRGGEKWHTFTREHNHGMYNAPKIIVPMTAKDTIAAYDDGRKGLYMDNANVWFVSVPNADETTMKAVAALINSTVFSVLAKVDANPQSGGYFKFNKQFLAPVPFPSSRLLSESRVRRKLASLHDEIRQLELRWCGENPNHRALTGLALNRKWRRLDDCCARLYGLTEGEIAAVGKVGRTIDRTQLLPQT